MPWHDEIWQSQELEDTASKHYGNVYVDASIENPFKGFVLPASHSPFPPHCFLHQSEKNPTGATNQEEDEMKDEHCSYLERESERNGKRERKSKTENRSIKPFLTLSLPVCFFLSCQPPPAFLIIQKMFMNILLYEYLNMQNVKRKNKASTFKQCKLFHSSFVHYFLSIPECGQVSEKKLNKNILNKKIRKWQGKDYLILKKI